MPKRDTSTPADGAPLTAAATTTGDDQQPPPQPVTLPEDLTAQDDTGVYTVADEDLAHLHEAAQAEFDALYEGETAPDAAGLARANELVSMIEDLRAEQGRRDEVRQANADEMAQLRTRVHGDDTEPDADAEPVIEGELVDAAPMVAATTRGTIPVDRQRLDRGKASLNANLRRLAADPAAATRGSGPAFDPAVRRPTIDLATAARYAPAPRMPQGPPRDEAVLVAASDIPGYAAGTRLATVQSLAAAMVQRAKSVSIGRSLGGAATRHPVAYMERQYTHELPDRYDPAALNAVLLAATNPQTLVAAGGWCAPPTTSYDFYSVVCEDGMWDAPTIGAPRGSVQTPVSPSFGDIMGLDDNPWTWTNEDDVEAAGTNGPEKPCQHIACPETVTNELECDGICLTVGNLVNFAWPELVEHQTQLLMAAQAHYMNMRKILAVAAGSTAVTVSLPSSGQGVLAPLLDALTLQAWDIREKERMCQNSILETVLPRFVIGMLQSDLTLRQGVSPQEAFALSLAWLADWLDVRGLRAQLVSDWQIGGEGQLGGATPATAWPATIQALVYTPGAWIVPQGLRLNLGVIRDSVLNRTNDHTAAWMEECFAVVKVGNESRRVTVDICPNGATNAGTELLCAGS